MKEHLFNVRMSCSEARRILFMSVEGKTKKEVEEIKKEYSSVSRLIRRREITQNKGWMTKD